MKNKKDIRYGIYGWVDFTNLPRLKSYSQLGKVIWEECKDNIVPFSYKDTKGTLLITGYDKPSAKVCLIYNNEKFSIYRSNLYNAEIGKVVRDTVDVTHPHLLKYAYNKEDLQNNTHGSRNAIMWRCPDCGHEREAMMYAITNRGYSCPACSDGVSYPNKFMNSVLSQLNITFVSEKRFDWCKFNINGTERIGVYDFYFKLGNMKYIVEMDGDFHYKDKWGNDQKAKDNHKDTLAKRHGVEMIRIDSRKSEVGYIRNNILNSRLSEILKLSEVNWDICNKQATNSIVKDVCSLYNKGNCTIKNISEELKISEITVERYLKKGKALGLCEYLTISERRLLNMKNTFELYDSGIHNYSEIGRRLGLSNCSVGNYIREREVALHE